MALVIRTNNSSPQRSKSIIYSDFKTSFQFSFVKKDLESDINEEAVKTSIKNILLTNRGERFFNPNFGSDIRSVLFENYTSATEQIISDLVKNAINNFEPRANVIEVLVKGDPDNNQVYVTIIFSIINKSEPITFEIILDRVR